MNLIYEQLQKIKEDKRIGLMTHIVLGYPTLDESMELVRAMAGVGADFIELQIPFSDPLGDGPTIMKANHAALAAGMTVDKAFEAMNELSREVGARHALPLLFMTYYQIVFRRGIKKFCDDAAKAGASGLMVPDIPADEEHYDHYFSLANASGLVPMKFLSASSSSERIKTLRDGDFLYVFAQQNTTGARALLAGNLAHQIQRIKEIVPVPIAVGFGISKLEHVREIKQTGADVAVIGSAVLNVLHEAREGEKIESVKGYLKTLIEAAR